jgi:hypothetical protein
LLGWRRLCKEGRRRVGKKDILIRKALKKIQWQNRGKNISIIGMSLGKIFFA